MGSKCHHKCLYKREVQEDHRQEAVREVELEKELCLLALKVKEGAIWPWQGQRNRFSPKSSGRSMAMLIA